MGIGILAEIAKLNARVFGEDISIRQVVICSSEEKEAGDFLRSRRHSESGSQTAD